MAFPPYPFLLSQKEILRLITPVTKANQQRLTQHGDGAENEGDNEQKENEEEIESILQAVLDPLITVQTLLLVFPHPRQICSASSNTMDKISATVYMLNCFALFMVRSGNCVR